MTDDLDTLRPEVQGAINRTDVTVEMFDTLVTVNRDDYDIIRAELLRLATIEADALIALDCEHDWQVEHERAEKAEAELAALKARIAEAPTRDLFKYFIPDHVDADVRHLIGKRVRLVVEE